METIRWNVLDEEEKSSLYIEAATHMLKSGQTVAFPTETVYGLGADATNNFAVEKIFQAKGRPADNPLIAHVATKEQLTKVVHNIPPYVDKLIDAFSPGPITYVLPSSGICAENVTAGLETIGVRIPSHPVAQQLLLNCDMPIAAPSANLSGKPSPTTADHVWQDLAGKIGGLIDGGQTGVGVESTVIDCTEQLPIILRPGGITKEELEKVVGKVIVDPALVNTSAKPKAPGMKYTHYAPEVPLWLIAGSPEKIQEVINKAKREVNRIGVLASSITAKSITADEIISLGTNLSEVATNLYDGLRYFKKGTVDLIICESFQETGIGHAIMNRLHKAATKFMKV